jgi:hypothetical protein
MNQKIVVAASFIAIVLSLANLTVLLWPKSSNGNLVLPSSEQNLYVANVTTRDYEIYNFSVVNPTNEPRGYYYWILFFSTNETVIGSNYDAPLSIQPETTQYFVWTPMLHDLPIVSQKVEITLFDLARGFVYDKTLNVLNMTQT